MATVLVLRKVYARKFPQNFTLVSLQKCTKNLIGFFFLLLTGSIDCPN